MSIWARTARVSATPAEWVERCRTLLAEVMTASDDGERELLDALAHGAPVVTSAGTATAEVAGPDGETCYMTIPGDSESLAAGIRRALEDPVGAQRIAGDHRCTIGSAGPRPVRVDHPLHLAEVPVGEIVLAGLAFCCSCT